MKRLCKHWAYSQVQQVGSHIILQTSIPSSRRVAVPAHNSLRIGTLNAIVSAVAAQKGVEKEEILKGI